jgi:transposase
MVRKFELNQTKGGKLMKSYHKYIGLDVHKERNEVAIADASGEVRLYGSISNDLHALEKLVVKLRGEKVVLHFVYEAGPCGFVIQRRLQQLGEDCIVVAPSLIPRKSGDRVKTDRRDAITLARLHRAGELTGIHVPDPRDEAIRDLIRARTDAVTDRRDNRHRLKAFLLRHGYKYCGKSSWTEPHLRYLRELVLADPAHKVVLEEYLLAITQATERIERLETHLATLADEAGRGRAARLARRPTADRRRAGGGAGRSVALPPSAPTDGVPRPRAP